MRSKLTARGRWIKNINAKPLRLVRIELHKLVRLALKSCGNPYDRRRFLDAKWKAKHCIWLMSWIKSYDPRDKFFGAPYYGL